MGFAEDFVPLLHISKGNYLCKFAFRCLFTFSSNYFFLMISPELPLDEQIREIKRMLRAVMNGVVSGSMRRQGLTYRVNFGVDLPRLLEIAQEMPHTTTLALALRKENIRELRLLASMLYPREEMSEEMALLWVEEFEFAEEAQVFVLHLLHHLPFASDMAFRLVASERPLERLTGWLLLGRLFMDGFRPTQRDADEVLDHLDTELRTKRNDREVQRTALNTLYKFMELGDAEAARGERILQSLGY